jgi:tetratricopeptide (TPR) repeat protein
MNRQFCTASVGRVLSTTLALILGFSAVAPFGVRAQDAQDEAIKKAIHAETDAWFGADPEAWAGCWLHDQNCTRTLGSATVRGWEGFGPNVIKDLKDRKPFAMELKNEHYMIRKDNNLAWVVYDQRVIDAHNPTNASASKEFRVLSKQNGDWKIVSQITESDENPSQNIEARLNDTGYVLLGAGKTQEAIEVFQLNVRLFPTSANTYDSLGEAQAAAGDKPMAIKNYEKAVELDPSRDSSRAALAKLKQ